MHSHGARTEPFPTNADFARFVAEVADALSEFPHLPVAASLTVGQGGRPLLSLARHTNNVPLAHATWGEALGYPVTVDTRERRTFGLDRVRTKVMLRGIECVFEDPISEAETKLCLSAVEIQACPGLTTTILASDLLRVLDTAVVTG